jgi:YidC/Oxa1 family membrane protein insertase
MGITMFLQQKLNPQPPDPMQAKIFMFLPLVFTFMLAQFPAGLVIYWAWNNTLSILQQSVIMRRAGVKIGR